MKKKERRSEKFPGKSPCPYSRTGWAWKHPEGGCTCSPVSLQRMKTMKKLMAIWTRKYPYHFNGTRWSYGTTQFEVKILATSEGYAMVRRQSAIPFVVAEKELSRKSQDAGRAAQG